MFVPPLRGNPFLFFAKLEIKCFFASNCDYRYSHFLRKLEKRSLSYNDGPVLVPLDDAFLADNVQRICVCGCDTGMWFVGLGFRRVSMCSFNHFSLSVDPTNVFFRGTTLIYYAHIFSQSYYVGVIIGLPPTHISNWRVTSS